MSKPETSSNEQKTAHKQNKTMRPKVVEQLTEEQKQFFRENYGTLPTKEICKKIGITKNQFSAVRQSLGIEPLKRGETTKVSQSKTSERRRAAIKKRIATRNKQAVEKLIAKPDIVSPYEAEEAIEKAQREMAHHFQITHSDIWEVRRQQLALEMFDELLDKKGVMGISEEEVVRAVHLATAFISELKQTKGV